MQDLLKSVNRPPRRSQSGRRRVEALNRIITLVPKLFGNALVLATVLRRPRKRVSRIHCHFQTEFGSAFTVANFKERRFETADPNKTAISNRRSLEGTQTLNRNEAGRGRRWILVGL